MSLNKEILDKFPSEAHTGKRPVPHDELNCPLKFHKEFCKPLFSAFSTLVDNSEVSLVFVIILLNWTILRSFRLTFTFGIILVLKPFLQSQLFFFPLKWVAYIKGVIHSEI